ncbi:MAG TPA: class I SAM-dependent methyltransferase [Kofleriaceae bacterium]|nr:class I SAM-dependent methyltransferase [Kofleriaceae bacterium]
MFECRNCKAHRAEPIYHQLRDRFEGHPGTFDYVRCGECSLVQLAEIPPDLEALYMGYRVHGRTSSLYHLLRKLTIGHAYLSTSGEGRSLLDFGCGSGWYLQQMAELGWQATGYESNADHAAHVSRVTSLPVLSGLDSLKARTGEFDLVTMNFVFEHLADPHEMLDLVSRVLRPGGQLYISVPNIESREARIFKDRWFHLDPPRHLTFFTKAMLSEMFAARGLVDIEVKDLPIPTGLAGSLSYKVWGKFEPVTWYSLIVPGLVFSKLVRDGNFAISARRPL